MVESEKGVSDILVDFEFGVDLPKWMYENNFNILFLKTIQMSPTPFSLSTIQLYPWNNWTVKTGPLLMHYSASTALKSCAEPVILRKMDKDGVITDL